MENDILMKLFDAYCNIETIKSDPKGYCKQFFCLVELFKSTLNNEKCEQFDNIIDVIFDNAVEEQLFSFKQGFKAGFSLANMVSKEKLI